MTTEDETFRRLKQTDFETLRSYLLSLSGTEFREIYKTAADKSVFFLSHGWTVQEFEKLAWERNAREFKGK